MGIAGAPLPYYVSHLEPGSAFGLAIAVNTIAMPMIGGTTTWIGPSSAPCCWAARSRSRP